MKKLTINKRITLLSVVGLTLIGGASAFAYQANRPVESKPINSTQAKAPANAEIKKETPVVETPIAPAVESQVVQPVAQQQPVVEPVTQPQTVRSYDQLIADYGYAEYKFALDTLKAKYPERFSDSMIEDTFAYIKRLYYNPHTAQGNIERHGWDIAR